MTLCFFVRNEHAIEQLHRSGELTNAWIFDSKCYVNNPMRRFKRVKYVSKAWTWIDLTDLWFSLMEVEISSSATKHCTNIKWISWLRFGVGSSQSCRQICWRRRLTALILEISTWLGYWKFIKMCLADYSRKCSCRVNSDFKWVIRCFCSSVHEIISHIFDDYRSKVWERRINIYSNWLFQTFCFWIILTCSRLAISYPTCHVHSCHHTPYWRLGVKTFFFWSNWLFKGTGLTQRPMKWLESCA